MAHIAYDVPALVESWDELRRVKSAPGSSCPAGHDFDGQVDDEVCCTSNFGKLQDTNMQCEDSSPGAIPQMPDWLERTRTQEEWLQHPGFHEACSDDCRMAFCVPGTGGLNAQNTSRARVHVAGLPAFDVSQFLRVQHRVQMEKAHERDLAQISNMTFENKDALAGAPACQILGMTSPQRESPFGDVRELSLRARTSSNHLAFSVRSKAAELTEPLTAHIEDDGTTMVVWKLDKRLLMSKDTTAVSPHFNLPVLGSQTKANFMMIFEPKAMSEKRGARGFKNCAEGVVRLKCQDNEVEPGASVTFSISLSGRVESDPRGPVTYDVEQGSLCGLPLEQEGWTFRDDAGIMTLEADDFGTFSVRLKVAPIKDGQ